MPGKKQHRAAHTKGVSQKAGKEFVEADKNDAPAEEAKDIVNGTNVAEAFETRELPTETDAIRQVREKGVMRYGPLWLMRMRVSGTGIAYRPSYGEWVYRPREEWLTREMLERVNGLPILIHHSEEEGPVHGEEYHDRQIGILVSPWIDGDELWGVGKIYDDTDALAVINFFPSTSPSVTFAPGKGEMVEINGERMFIEPPPMYIDHLAVVPEGVWDKYGHRGPGIR